MIERLARVVLQLLLLLFELRVVLRLLLFSCHVVCDVMVI